MGAETKIQWTDFTFNPWRGCQKVSPGCQHCYAETMSRRNPKVLGEWGPEGSRVVASESYWRQPLKWDREAAERLRQWAASHRGKAACDEPPPQRSRVFCASLADVFEDRPELVAPRVRLFHLISETPNLDWLLLTKRPENVRRFHGGDGAPRSWSENMPPNVWLGVSVEDQARADERIPLLLQTPAAVRFLSCEPLLGPVDLERYLWLTGASTAGPWTDCLGRRRGGGGIGGQTISGKPSGDIQWIIVGGESGPHARPMELEWMRFIVRQCEAASVPVFCKQLGYRASDPVNGIAGAGLDVPEEASGLISLRLRDKKGGDWSEWPEDLRIRQFPEVRRD